MSFHIDRSFILRLSSKLQLFKRKGDEAFSCRCPICGDSKKSKTKSRGNFYRNTKYDSMQYKCFNCGSHLSAGQFIKKLDENLFKEYTFAKFNYNNDHRWHDSNLVKKENTVSKKLNKKTYQPAKKYLKPLHLLDDKHYAKQYIMRRRIPSKYWDKIYFTENYKKFINTKCDNTKFTETDFKKKDPRIVFVLLDVEKNEIGWVGRTLTNDSVRYITIKASDDVDTIYGLDSIKNNKPVYVFEGIIDSLFVENSLAAIGASLSKVNIKNAIYVYDNEPRNKDLCKIIKKSIEQNKTIVLLPNDIPYKDINSMVVEGKYKKSQITNLLKKNTCSGMDARVKFLNWKRCNV